VMATTSCMPAARQQLLHNGNALLDHGLQGREGTPESHTPSYLQDSFRSQDAGVQP
jgi:hypothetical protein